MTLAETVGKSIDAFCGNRFNGAGENHCAHFVSHVLQIDTGYNCRIHTGRGTPGASLRVHELFSACPRVAAWTGPVGETHLMFVTDRANVDLGRHTMRNVPRKHVGIFGDGHVYHYSNTRDLVVRETPAQFLARFQGSYGGNQALFFGALPAGAVVPAGAPGPGAVRPATVDATHGTPVPSIRSERTSNGRWDYYATLPGSNEFYIGRETKYEGYRGLAQPQSKLDGPRYDAGDFFDEYDSVAGMLGVIAAGESAGYFSRINSYDRAAFTYGFFQFAAHTPRDNLILLFRALAKDDAAFQALFPDLRVIDGTLHRLVGDHAIDLEKAYPRPERPSESNLRDFMRYLNPDGTQVDDTELSVAARLVYLADNHASSRRQQVRLAANITMHKLRSLYAFWYDLDGMPDLVCTAIADIHHQGRGTRTQVREALASSGLAGKIRALCRIGEDRYASRCESLRKGLQRAKDAGRLGISVFDRGSGLFKPSGGWPE